MTRPKGSKNKLTLQKEELERQQTSNIIKQDNTYDDYISDFVEGYIAKLYSDGIIKTIDNETLQQWFSSPDKYIEDINNLLNYYYIANGDIFQLYDLVSTLPTLNYKIDIFDRRNNYEKDLELINKILVKKVKHRQLTRDILSQLISKGTLIGIWLGNKANPYFFIFDELKYVFPSHRLNGEWIAKIDLKWFDTMEDEERQNYFSNLSPYITQEIYNNYKIAGNEQNQYVSLPSDKTCVLRTHTIDRNQRLGLPWGLQSLFNIQHKQKLKDLEISISNKIINAISVLKLSGIDTQGNKVNPNVKKKVVSRVKTALEQNTKTGITLIAIPDFATFEFPDMKIGDKALDPSKYESINNDISVGTGVSPTIVSGTGGNYASGKLNLDIIYKKIGTLLEDIESNVYDKLFKLILPANMSDNYQLIYDKETPLSLKEKVDILFKLHSEGYALKPIIDSLDGIDYQSYIDQSIYEIDTLKLREKILPPKLSYTTSGSDNKGGAPTIDDSTNPSTISTKTLDGNNTPRANS